MNIEKSKEDLINELKLLKEENLKLNSLYQNEKNERLKLVSELEIVNERIDLTMKSANFAWWEMDVETGTVKFSPHKAEMLGFPPEKFKHYEDFTSLVHPEDYPKVMEAMHSHLNGLTDKYDINFRIKNVSDDYIFFKDIGKITQRDENGKPLLVTGIALDINEKIHLDEVLKISESQLKKAEEIGKFGNWQLNLKNNILYSSNGASKIYGLESNKNSLEMIQTATLSTYREFLDKSLNDFINNDIPYDVEYKIKRFSDGEIVDIHTIAEYDKENNIIFGTIQDTTERNRINESLILSELQIRTIINDMNVGVLLQGPNAEIILSNPKALELLGLSLDQLLGKTSFDPDWNVIHEDGSDFPGATHPVPQAISAKSPIRNVIMGVYNPISKDRAWLLVDAIPQLEENGEVKQVVCSFIDITERKYAEDQLIENEKKYRQFYNNTPVMLHSIDSNGKLISVSDYWIANLGYDREEVIGHYSSEFLTEYSRKYANEIVLPEFKKNGYCNNVEYQFIKKNGEILETLLSAISEFDEKGTFLRSITVIVDISDRKKAEVALKENEEKLKSLFGSMTEMVALHELVFDENGKPINYRIIDCNNSFTRITGIPQELAIGKLATEVYNTEEAPFLGMYSMVASTGIPDEYSIYFEPMEKHFNVTIVSPKLNHFATITTDITLIKNSEKLISQKNNELLELNATKDKFFSIIAHDLINPMGNFMQMTELLHDSYDDFDDNELIEFLDLMKKSSSRLYSLLENLLEWSRSQRGKIQFEPIETNLYLLVENIIDILNTIANDKKIQIKNNIKKITIIFADVNLLSTILRNLISNALKFTNSCGEITISAEFLNGEILISVVDTGVGMNKETLIGLFKIDSASSTLGTNKERGTGLGLILCKEFVEKHRGKIWAESEVGNGSTFFFTLPN